MKYFSSQVKSDLCSVPRVASSVLVETTADRPSAISAGGTGETARLFLLIERGKEPAAGKVKWEGNYGRCLVPVWSFRVLNL